MNRGRVIINWRFTRRKARQKFDYKRNQIMRSETWERPRDPEAHDHYLRGRYHYARFNLADAQKAVSYNAVIHVEVKVLPTEPLNNFLAAD